jgi:hypothetical protein
LPAKIIAIVETSPFKRKGDVVFVFGFDVGFCQHFGSRDGPGWAWRGYASTVLEPGMPSAMDA